VVCLAVTAIHGVAQRQRGELRLEVLDPAGSALVGPVDVVSELNELHRYGNTDATGHYTTQDLPFGLYRVRVSHEGFQAFTQLVRVGSEVPVVLTVTLGVAPVHSAVEVTDSATLVDPNRTSTVNSIGTQSIAEHVGSQPGRSLLEGLH
jgi:hypothetical protein